MRVGIRYRLLKLALVGAMFSTIMLIVLIIKSPLVSPEVSREEIDHMYQSVDQGWEGNEDGLVAPGVKPVNPHAPGEMGRPVNIEKEKLSPEDRLLYDDGWKNNSFNQFVSDQISLHRSLPDIREKECRGVQTRPVIRMPPCSIIVVFHNEAWSTLLRTVHSVLNRSPPRLIKEILLVDDYSTMEHLHAPLDDYVSRLDKVRVVRGEKREGLIRARLLGASVAKGEVLVFLDSHCEAMPGWLEFLLDPLLEDPSTVTVPVIDIISEKTFQFQYIPPYQAMLGGFDWNMMFSWHPVTRSERKIQGKETNPIRSPTMAGGLFAINKDYFYKLGAYDEGMQIWGGENLEISFRIWMCGGTILTIPCSHVGHVYRSTTPYKFAADGGSEGVIRRNRVRMAEVWMDHYKKYFYHFKLFDNLGQFGDVTERKLLRKKLKCKTFGWYLDNIYPSKFVPMHSLAAGEIRQAPTSMCVDAMVDGRPGPLTMMKCHGLEGTQVLFLSRNNEIRTETTCLGLKSQSRELHFGACDEYRSSKWEYTKDDQLVTDGQCLTYVPSSKKAMLAPCSPRNEHQIWAWHRTNGTWVPS